VTPKTYDVDEAYKVYSAILPTIDGVYSSLVLKPGLQKFVFGLWTHNQRRYFAPPSTTIWN
jgi:hypothetical protein